MKEQHDLEFHMLNYNRTATEGIEITSQPNIRVLSFYFPKGSKNGFMLTDLIPYLKVEVTNEQATIIANNPIVLEIINQIKQHYK